MSTREKGEIEDMANADKPWCEREVKTYIPHKVQDQREVQGPQRTQEAPLQPSYSVLSVAHNSKETLLAYPSVVLQRNSERCGATLLQTTALRKEGRQAEGKIRKGYCC